MGADVIAAVVSFAILLAGLALCAVNDMEAGE